MSLAQFDPLTQFRSFLERALINPWVTLVEMLLIGSIVYAVLAFLRGTRGERLVRAILIILAVSFAVVRVLAEQFELAHIKLLYPYFLFAVFLVALVAFQTELRRLLLRLGEVRWFSLWGRDEQLLIDPVVTAVSRMSKKRVGALIAVVRATEVGGLIESGVRLEARITPELLENIFWPGAPLHDLGVVISQGVVVAAGCQFPLAEFGDVDRSLGSRHRAAVGMSHETDAVVIIVSEETGAISVAIGGVLRRFLSAEELRTLLREELSGHSSRTKLRRSKAAAL